MRRRALLARTALLTTPLAALTGCSALGGDGTASPGRAPSESPTVEPTPSPRPSPSPTASPTPAAVRTPDGTLAVAEHALTRSNEGSESELVGVDAVVENTGDTAVTDVRVVARFLDESGQVLDESEARTDRIAAGGRWAVELLFGASGADARAVADYRLVIERVD